jgi:small subunit ribosomal protein S3
MAFRLGVIKTWTSKWYETSATRSGFTRTFASSEREGVPLQRERRGVEVERAANKAKVIVYTARPGMVIGKGGKGIEILKTGNLDDRRQG